MSSSSSSSFGALLPVFLYEVDPDFAGFLRFVEARGVTRNKRFPLLLGASSHSPTFFPSAFASEERDAFADDARLRIFLLVAIREGRCHHRCLHGFRVSPSHQHLVEEIDGARLREAWEEFCAARRMESCCENDQHVLDTSSAPENAMAVAWAAEAYESMRRLVTVPVWSTVASYEAVPSPFSSSVDSSCCSSSSSHCPTSSSPSSLCASSCSSARAFFDCHQSARSWGSSVEGRQLLRSCTNVVGGRVELPARIYARELFVRDAPRCSSGRHPPVTPHVPAALRCGACTAAPGSSSSALNCAACAAGEALRQSLVRRPVMEQGWYARVLCAAVTHSAKDHLEKSIVVQQLADGRIFRFAEGPDGNLPMRRADRLGLAQGEDRHEEVMDAMCSDVDAVMHCYMRSRQERQERQMCEPTACPLR
jgi:hypothetical protein